MIGNKIKSSRDVRGKKATLRSLTAKGKIAKSGTAKSQLGRKDSVPGSAAKPGTKARKKPNLFLKPNRAPRVIDIREKFGLSQGEFSRITGYAIRSIAGWESGKSLSASARQKITETNRLCTALSELVPKKELHEWMRSPNPAFEGRTPIQIIELGETDRIWRMIAQIDAGVAN